MDIDQPLTDKIDSLLRSDPRLGAAAALIGMVAAVYKEAPPAKAAPTPKEPAEGKKPPPRADGSESSRSDASADEVTLPPPGPPACPSPWHKAAVLSKANGLAKFDNGQPILAVVTVNGAEWDLLNGGQQEASLVMALRGLRHKERVADGQSLAVVEKPPIRCWPDVREEAAELMAALCEDPAQAAALAGALSEADPIEALDAAVGDIVRRLDAGQDLDLDRVEALRVDLRDAVESALARETA